MNIAEFSIKKRTITLVLTILMLGGGIMAYQKLGRLEDPEFTIKSALVITPYPGASAAEVEEEVTNEIEKACQQLGQLDYVKSKSERFVLIEPPLRPEEPDSPNRLAIILIGFILALGSGGGHVALRESADDSVHNLRDLAEVLGAAPLGAVAYFETRVDIHRQRWRTFGYTAGFLLLIGAALVAMHFLYLPLDVLSIKVMRRLGV